MKIRSKKNTGYIGLVIIIIMLFAFSAHFEAQAKSKLITQKLISEREITGEVLSFSPRNKPELITIAVDKENADYMVYIDAKTKIVHKKDLSSIQKGDTVRIKFSTILETNPKGRQWERRLAQRITFVRSPSNIKGLRSN